MKQSTTRRFTTIRLVTNALFAALYIIFACFATVKTPLIEFSFASMPVIFCALLLRSVDAMVVALIGSFIEQLISPYGLTPTTPLWLLPWILLGALVGGLAYLFPFLREKGMNTRKAIVLVCVVLLGELMVTAFNTAALYLDGWIMKYAVKALNLIVIPRLINCLVRSVCTCLIIVPLLPPVQKLFSMRKNS